MKNKNIKIYNSLSRRKDILKPLTDRRINLFVCGPTVYDFSHIGHARTYIIFDCLVKYLKQMGFKVFYLQNITDIDDKIIVRAKEKGVPTKDIAETFAKEYLKNMKSLGIISVTKYARATKYIKEIISQVQRLLEKGYGYRLEQGIYFDISKFDGYGKLSGRTVLKAEDVVSRIDYGKNKKNRGDFCLWKFNEHKDEPSWPSPFGWGRPGWHIEDTAITEKFFGSQYDIHGGGRDLVFPHHEAEISQMEAISGKKPMVKYFIHSGVLTREGQKMSKSLQNFITIDDFLRRHPYRYLRFWVAKNLWKAPLDYSESAMTEVKSALEKIEEFLIRLKYQKSKGGGKRQDLKTINKLLTKAKNDFYKNLNDDFNTPKAFAVIFKLIKETNKFFGRGRLNEKSADRMYQFFQEINKVFDIIDFRKLGKAELPREVKKILLDREKCRKNSQWQKADQLRKEIEKYGFLVEDTRDGPVLKKISR